MTIAWMLYVLLVGGLLSCAALAIEGVLRRMGRPTRWVWVGALAAIIVFAAVAPGARQSGAAGAEEISALVAKSAAAPGKAMVLAVPVNPRDRVTSAVISGILAVQARVPRSAAMPLAIAWAASSAVLLLVIVGVHRRVDRERRSWLHADVDGVPVRIAADVGPAVIGLSKPEIVVPRWLLGRSKDEQRLVIVHEREHVIAHDQLLPIGAWIVAALLPWHPATWWVLSRLRLAIELDCDARVLSRGVRARPYGNLLIDIAGQCAGHRVGALALADGTSHLERRLLAMKPARSRFVFVRTAVLGAIAMSAILVACESRLPTSADISSMDVASAEKAAEDSHLFAKEPTTARQYFLNDSAISAAFAHTIAPGRIEGVEIAKSASGGPDKIFIRTRGTLHLREDADSTKGTVHFKVQGQGDAAYAFTNTTASGLVVSQNPQAAKRFEGIVYIDGLRATERAIAEIPRGEIAAIDVLKGDAALSKYSDPAAANGVILVRTKHGSAPDKH